MAFDVEHLFGINIAPAMERLSEETRETLWEEHHAHIQRVYEREDDYAILGVKVPTTPRGVVVTAEVEAAAKASLEALPPAILEEIRVAMETHPERLAVYGGTISEAEERAWRAGGFPEPNFYVCPCWA